MRGRRDVLIVCGLFLVLLLFIVLGPGRQRPPEGPSGPTTHSSEPDGAMALYSWTRALGYDGRRLEYRPFELGEDDAALVILNPSEPIGRAEARRTLDWVERGGTLILSEDSSIVFGAPNALFDELKVDLAVYSTTTTIERAAPAQPALDQPPGEPALVRTGRHLLLNRSDYVKLVGPADAVVVAGLKHGAGYIYLSAATYPFTNEGLRDAANAGLVLNMLRRVPAGGRIQFDEYHHGFFQPPSTGTAFLSTPWGWASAYALVAVVLYLILSGRRFGRPVPLKEELARRSSSEYVESMADLFQRGGKRGFILRHYHDAFKRRIARPYGINPQLDDAEFVYELARFREFDQPALLALMARLRDEQVGEAGLVRTVADAEALLGALSTKTLP